ncbi:MAG: hypothetical protein LBT05_14020 [Planctomycetaceae bacterium]|jgi:hypothetical protein|nr:hypothetical protein [Planctomycetaceae bacterium]
MITSSLPPEWKVLIAGGILLGGVLLALRFPAKRDLIQASVNAVRSLETNANSPETTFASTSNPIPSASAVIDGERGSTFVSSDDFLYQNADNSVSVADSGFDQTAYRERWETSATDSDNASNALSHADYGEFNENGSSNSAEEIELSQHSHKNIAEKQMTEILPQASYAPFNPPSISRPNPDPTFFADLPSPPTLISSLTESPATPSSSPNVADILFAHSETSTLVAPPLSADSLVSAAKSPVVAASVSTIKPEISIKSETLTPKENVIPYRTVRPVLSETTMEKAKKTVSRNNVITGSGRTVILPNH